MRKIDPVLHERLATLINSMGYELVGCEIQSSSRQTLFRIYIDKEGTGVTANDCSLVSRQVSAMFDVEEPLSGRYLLEVSSPGIDRPLFELDHYRRFVGKQIRIRLYTAINGQRQYRGELERVEGEDLYILVTGSEQALKVPFSTIDKGNLIGDIGFVSQKPDVKNQEPND